MTTLICRQLRKILTQASFSQSKLKRVEEISTCLYCTRYNILHFRLLSTSILPIPIPSVVVSSIPNSKSTFGLNNGSFKYLAQNTENNNAEVYMRGAPGYRDTFLTPASLDEAVDFHPVVRDFISASLEGGDEMESVISPTHKAVVDGVLSNLKVLNDLELLQVLYHLRHFAHCDRADNPEYMRIWTSLDEECLSRSQASSWSLDLLFQAADVWCGLKLGRYSAFYKSVMWTCLKKCGRLKKEHFIRWMYCLNIARRLPSPGAKYDIEDYLRVNLEGLNHHEISLVAMACFKTETAISDPEVFEGLLNIAILERKRMDSISVAAVAKFARFCSNVKVKSFLFGFQEAFMSELDRVGIQACTHLALIGTKTQMAYLPLVNAVVKIIEGNIQDARLKDLERIALAMTMFDADCDALGNLIVGQLRAPSRGEEMKEYGRCLPAILHYLSIREIFPHDLIDLVLDKKFRETFYENTSEIYLRELLCLDFCVGLEVEGYSGARLDEETRDHVSKSHAARVNQSTGSKVSKYEMSLRKVSNVIESFLGGSQYYLVCNILPHHHSRKIVFCTDAMGKPVMIPDEYRNLPEHQIKYIDGNSTNIKYHVLFTCNRNDFISLEKKLTGSGKLIVRQLMKMGYHVHVLYPPFTVTQLNDMFQNL